MGKRLSVVAILAALGALAFAMTRIALQGSDSEGPTSGGLVVHVRVEDPDGDPVPSAQARPLFSEGPWQPVDGAGCITLRGVVLNAGATPTAETIGAAIGIRARFLAARTPPSVRETDGAWEATFRLSPHGVVRLFIEPTHLAPIKAWIEPVNAGQIETMGGRSVARLDLPAAFRVPPGVEELVVRVQGESDPLGVIRAASDRFVVPAPAPNVVKQIAIRAKPAMPITGQVVTVGADGVETPFDAPDTEVMVYLMDGDERSYELGRVPVTQGSFVVPFTGRGPYALVVHSPLRAPGPMQPAGGNTDVRLLAGRVRPWLRIEHDEVDPRKERLHLSFVTADGHAVRPTHAVQRERTWTRAVFDEPPGALTIHARRPGTRTRRPADATQHVDLGAAGETAATLSFTPVPHGTVRVKAPEDALAFAHVAIGDRETTLAPARVSTLMHVRAGPDVSVAAMWKPKDGAPTWAAHIDRMDIAAGETTTIQIPGTPGGYVAWHGPRSPAARLTWPDGDASPYGVSGAVPMQWLDGRWRTRYALKPGTYRATVNGIPVSFTVTTGAVAVATASD